MPTIVEQKVCRKRRAVVYLSDDATFDPRYRNCAMLTHARNTHDTFARTRTQLQIRQWRNGQLARGRLDLSDTTEVVTGTSQLKQWERIECTLNDALLNGRVDNEAEMHNPNPMESSSSPATSSLMTRRQHMGLSVRVHALSRSLSAALSTGLDAVSGSRVLPEDSSSGDSSTARDAAPPGEHQPGASMREHNAA